MIDGDRASENDIVLAFLRAEINSTKPDVRELYAHCLGRWRLDRVSLIDQGDLADEDANRNRKNVVGCARGFGLGKSLFRGFPTDTAWRRVRVEPSDYHRLKCISGDGD